MNRLFPSIISAIVIMLCDMLMTLTCSPIVSYLADFLSETLPNFTNVGQFIEVLFNNHPFLVFACVVLWLIFSTISKQYDSDEFGAIR